MEKTNYVRLLHIKEDLEALGKTTEITDNQGNKTTVQGTLPY
jgi:uncharacterized protein Veg